MRALRTILTIVMDILIAIAVALSLRVVVLFFGQLAVQPWARSVVHFTQLFVIPFGMPPIKTPYHGVFDVNAALSILAILAAEWILSVVRARD